MPAAGECPMPQHQISCAFLHPYAVTLTLTLTRPLAKRMHYGNAGPYGSAQLLVQYLVAISLAVISPNRQTDKL